MGVLRRRHLMACLISSAISRSGWSSGQTEWSGLAPLVVKALSFCVQIPPQTSRSTVYAVHQYAYP